MNRLVLVLLYFPSREINASAIVSGFTIKSHYCPMPNEQEYIKVIAIYVVNSWLLYRYNL